MAKTNKKKTRKIAITQNKHWNGFGMTTDSMSKTRARKTLMAQSQQIGTRAGNRAGSLAQAHSTVVEPKDGSL